MNTLLPQSNKTYHQRAQMSRLCRPLLNMHNECPEELANDLKYPLKAITTPSEEDILNRLLKRNTGSL